MDIQLDLLVPIPIMEEIISLSTISSKLTFRATCKRFLRFTTTHFFPIFTTTLCGNIYGYKDGELTHSQFRNPFFGVLNSSCTILYVSDHHNHVIRKIDISTNQITTLCGNPLKRGWKDGMSNKAHLWRPTGLALNEKENLLYVADSCNHVIRSVNLIDGRVDTLVGIPGKEGGKNGRKNGIGQEATFTSPGGLALDTVSNILYVASRNNHSIRRVLLNEEKWKLCVEMDKKDTGMDISAELNFIIPLT